MVTVEEEKDSNNSAVQYRIQASSRDLHTTPSICNQLDSTFISPIMSRNRFTPLQTIQPESTEIAENMTAQPSGGRPHTTPAPRKIRQCRWSRRGRRKPVRSKPETTISSTLAHEHLHAAVKIAREQAEYPLPFLYATLGRVN